MGLTYFSTFFTMWHYTWTSNMYELTLHYIGMLILPAKFQWNKIFQLDKEKCFPLLTVKHWGTIVMRIENWNSKDFIEHEHQAQIKLY
jgi:hypothetical protein